MHFAIYHSQGFDKSLEKTPPELRTWLEKMEDQLVENPYVGDMLRVPWFREKKFGKYRIYYLIYEELRAVYMVGISEKKDQQIIINTIWKFLDNFREEIERLQEKKST